jgi:glycine oxidase
VSKLQGKTLVVGGGVIGLLSAYALAKAGRDIVLIERNAVGQEASWAGGGIVSPLYPWRYGAAVSALAQWSQQFYPELGEVLAEQTGIDPQVFQTGLYWLDLEDAGVALDWAQRNARNLHEVDPEQVYSAVPELARRFSHALFMPEVANVRNPRLLKALRAALQAMPHVTLVENCAAREFLLHAGTVQGVRTDKGDFSADQVVLAAGAWSAGLLATLGLSLPVEPVRGQMILYKCAPDFLSSMVMADGRYAIPRRDGHVLVGSTLEYAGFDKLPTATALESLRASAKGLVPALEHAEVVRHWAGLRPGSPDGIPFIGPVPGIDGLWLNCGHFRNGLVLAPASCRLLVDLMLERTPVVDPAPYAPASTLTSS